MGGADPEVISSVTDPVRSRTFFLNVLNRPKQLEYLDKLISLMECYLAETKTHLAQQSQSGDLYDYLGSLGATQVTQARLKWLRIVRKRLTQSRN